MDIVRRAELIQRQAQQRRRSGQLKDAEDLLGECVELLRQEHNRLGAQQALPADSAASESAREVAALLADSLGSLAGVLRRRGLVEDALQRYKEGKALEEDDRYRISSTYNRVQWLVLSVLASRNFAATGEFHDEAQRLLPVVQRAAKSGDGQDPWRYADVALVALLLRNQRDALEALDVMKSLNPVAEVYKSGLPVLHSLSQALPEHDGLREAADWYAAELGS